MPKKPSYTNINHLCSTDAWPPDLKQHFTNRVGALVANGSISTRLSKVYLEVCNLSWKNFCNNIDNILIWKPELEDALTEFLTKNDVKSVDWVKQQQPRIEIARSVDGWSTKEQEALKLLPKSIRNQPKFIEFGLLEMQERHSWIALARFIRDIHCKRTVSAPEENFYSDNIEPLQQERIAHEQAMGLFVDDECHLWKQGFGPYPFPVSAILRSKDQPMTSGLSIFNPILVSITKSDVVDRCLYTFGDSMLPPLLVQHASEIMQSTAPNPLPNYAVQNLHDDFKMLKPKDLVAVRQKQLALPEAMAANLLNDTVFNTLLTDADYIEAQILGGYSLTKDVDKIYIKPNTKKLLDQILEAPDIDSGVKFDISELIDKGILVPWPEHTIKT